MQDTPADSSGRQPFGGARCVGQQSCARGVDLPEVVFRTVRRCHLSKRPLRARISSALTAPAWDCMHLAHAAFKRQPCSGIRGSMQSMALNQPSNRQLFGTLLYAYSLLVITIESIAVITREAQDQGPALNCKPMNFDSSTHKARWIFDQETLVSRQSSNPGQSWRLLQLWRSPFTQSPVACYNY